MAWPVVISTNGYGVPVTEAANGIGVPYEVADNGIGAPVVFVASGGTPVFGGYDPSASDLFARFTTPPTTARKALINTLIKSLKASGDWSKLDGFYMFAAADSQSARLNWISSLYTASSVSSPAFVVDQGYTSNGSTSYLDTGFRPSTDAGKYAKDSAHLAVFARTNLANDGYFDVGISDGSVSVLNGRRSTDANFRVALNEGSLATLGGGSVSTSIGHSAVERTGASAKRVIKDGVQLGTGTGTSTAIPTGTATFLRGGTSGGFSQRQISCGHFGQSGIDWSATYAAINTYLNAIGAI